MGAGYPSNRFGLRVLDIGERSDPWFGPRVFEDAAACPAKASNALAGWQLPPGLRSQPMNKTLGAWGAALDLLRVFARHGPTSGWANGTHPVTDLLAFAATTIPHHGRAVQLFAAQAVEALLDAQSGNGAGFNYEDTFIKVPFGRGSLHAGGPSSSPGRTTGFSYGVCEPVPRGPCTQTPPAGRRWRRTPWQNSARKPAIRRPPSSRCSRLAQPAAGAPAWAGSTPRRWPALM